MSDATIRIGRHVVGCGERVFVIAEAGVNHDGRIDDALRLIDAAAEAGADAVKFQIFSAEELAARDAPTAAYQSGDGTTQRELLQSLELPHDAFARLAARCAERGLVFLATPFGLRDVEALARLGAAAIKIASTDLDNVPLIRAATDAGVTLIVSTGAATRDELDAAVERLRAWKAAGRAILLHCVSSYPTPLEAANLRRIAALRTRYETPVGFSDHTTATRIGAWAVAAGACVLEKHFTLDRARPGPDHAMSLEPDQLREYISDVRAAEAALGDGEIEMQPIEQDVRRVARKSVFAATRIAAGSRLTRANLTTRRPGGGISPDRFDELLSRVAAVDIPPDTPLAWNMIR
ncbi:MAG: N-acetylneuraminate synthase [Planctomycetota bacterium]|nr:MAG: N-acetylneuraminate synthase [Planctomycetota bacterium]